MITISELNKLCQSTLIEHLGIEFTAVGKGTIEARMPVDNRTIQPMKRLHGGAVMALAETVGSAGSLLLVDASSIAVYGTEISGSHIGTTGDKYVIAKGKIIYQGKSSHVWEITVSDTNNNLISVCRMTNRLVPIKKD